MYYADNLSFLVEIGKKIEILKIWFENGWTNFKEW